MAHSLAQAISVLYLKKEYTNDPLTLALGVAEEAGEIAKAVNVHFNPKFKPTPDASADSVEHELVDCLIYLVALGNSIGFDLIEATYKNVGNKLVETAKRKD